MRILIVEDDPDVGVMIEWMLRKHDMESVLVTTSNAALTLLVDDTDFDGAIVDYMLQGSSMNGAELTSLLAEEQPFPVVLTTAARMMLERDGGPQVAVPVLLKPFTAEDLKQAFHA